MSYDPGDVAGAARTEAEVSFDRSGRGTDPGAGRGPAPAAPLGPGKQTLTAQLDAAIIQQRAAARAPEADVHTAAAHGIAGGATALPHLAPIQQAFGRHDVGHKPLKKAGLPANTQIYDMSGDEIGEFDKHTRELAGIAVKQR
jgi:hypothetical protein